MLYITLQFAKYEKQALIITGANQSASSETELRRILAANQWPPSNKQLPAPNFKVKIANENTKPVHKQHSLRFSIAGKHSEETFIIFPTMGNIRIEL